MGLVLGGYGGGGNGIPNPGGSIWGGGPTGWGGGGGGGGGGGLTFGSAGSGAGGNNLKPNWANGTGGNTPQSNYGSGSVLTLPAAPVGQSNGGPAAPSAPVRRPPRFAPSQGRSPADVAAGMFGAQLNLPQPPGLEDARVMAANVARGMTPQGREATPAELTQPFVQRPQALGYFPTSESDISRLSGIDPTYMRFLEAVYRTNMARRGG